MQQRADVAIAVECLTAADMKKRCLTLYASQRSQRVQVEGKGPTDGKKKRGRNEQQRDAKPAKSKYASRGTGGREMLLTSSEDDSSPSRGQSRRRKARSYSSGADGSSGSDSSGGGGYKPGRHASMAHGL